MFRIEKKYIFKKNKYYSIINYLKQYKIKKLYPDRYIHSLYFDNTKYKLFFDTVEGIMPRKKIRLRKYYSSNMEKHFLTNHDLSHFEKSTFEEKKSTYFGRQKKTFKNNYKNIIKNGMFVSNIGYLKPVIEIYYKRSYFSIKNYRITIDTNIIFKNKLKSNYLSKDMVVEFKFNPKELINFDTIFPYSERTSSKYCNAVNMCIFNGRIF
tara:strand:+ start:424 stop:1050 length:627 start_codon:yes stop_codon:yes gene_type:complete